VVLAIGRHEYQKGYDVLLRAFAAARASVPNARLYVAGRTTDLTPELDALAGSLGVGGAVEFLGIREDVPELLCAADVFAFSSRWEGMPGGVLEAMALEAPIVATDIAPVHEVLGTPPPGRVVPVDDAAAFGEALLAALVDDGVGVAAQTAAARERFGAQFTIERVAEQMVAFYERALTARR
jgi:glycosyltransferase involved in cell wall biosynthesis